ncbi:hypothetical protein [Micromonospora chersina]|uniref:hypothetical protein n=1 Tax=Micromonospora chersina TaxID=47854 RepID=UPI003711FE35
MNAIGMIVTVMMVSMLRVTWRMDRPSMTLVLLTTCELSLRLLGSDDRQEDLLQGGLAFHEFRLCGRQQLA